MFHTYFSCVPQSVTDLWSLLDRLDRSLLAAEERYEAEPSVVVLWMPPGHSRRFYEERRGLDAAVERRGGPLANVQRHWRITKPCRGTPLDLEPLGARATCKSSEAIQQKGA